MKNIKKITMFIAVVSLSIALALFSSKFMHSLIHRNDNLRELAIEKVNIIQENFNNGNLLETYNEGTSDFKRVITENDFLLFMKRKQEVLGNFVSSKLLASNVINSNVVTLTYRSTYENHSLIEEFQFIRENKSGDLQLGTYFIDDGGQRGEVIKQ